MSLSIRHPLVYYRFLWLAGWCLFLLWSHSYVYAQDSLAHRTLGFYLDKGLVNSPLVAENINSLSLNRLDSLLNVAANKPYVQATGQGLYAPAGKNYGYDQNATKGGQYTALIQANRNLQQQVASKVSLATGQHIEYGGTYAQQQQSFRDLLLILISASLLVFVVLLFLFRALKAAGLILFISVPGVSGSFIALFVTNTPLNVGSYTGIISVVPAELKIRIRVALSPILIGATKSAIPTGFKIASFVLTNSLSDNKPNKNQ